jgi:lipoate-protein ligase A
MYSFKDFLTVDYTGTGDEQLAKNAKRRKTDDTSGDLTASNDPTVDEALTQAQRQKMRAVFRKNKAKIKRGRDIAKRRLASDEKLKAKAMKKARDIMTNIEKQLEKRKGAIQRMAKKLFPKVKKADREKMRPITPAKGDTLK